MVFPLFQSLRPFYVATAMTYGTKANIVVPSPETYVKSALYTLGLSRRNTGYWSHGIQVFHYFIYSFSCYFSFSRIPYLTHSIFFFFLLLTVVLVFGIFLFKELQLMHAWLILEFIEEKKLFQLLNGDSHFILPLKLMRDLLLVRKNKQRKTK